MDDAGLARVLVASCGGVDEVVVRAGDSSLELEATVSRVRDDACEGAGQVLLPSGWEAMRLIDAFDGDALPVEAD